MEQMCLVQNCRVTNSSGCHRYSYWNEQAIFDDCPNTGWCSPSRSELRTEFLEILFPKSCLIGCMRMLSRSINPKSGFPIDLTLFAFNNNAWNHVFSRTGLNNNISTWHQWEFALSEATMARLEFTKVGKRDSGRYFTQFMNLEFYALE